MRTDFVTRESEHEVHNWATDDGFKQADKHWRRKHVLACAPKLDWVGDRVVNLHGEIAIGTVDPLGPVAEWRPLIGIAIKIFDKIGMRYQSSGGLGISDYYRGDTISDVELVSESAMRNGRNR